MKFYITLLMLVFAVSLNGQTFTMTGSSSTFVNNGKITFTSDNGQFQTDTDSDANIANSGTISFEGARADGIYFSNTVGADAAGAAGLTSDVRLSGWIYYSNTVGSGTQTVQSRYYTSLGVENAATKVYVSNGTLAPVYVSGTYNVVSGSGTRNYDGNSTTFVYDGNSEQIVFAENINGTSGRYYNLAFQGTGTKRVSDGTLVQAQNEIRTEASASGGVTVNGNMWAENNFIIEDGAGQFLVDGNTSDASLTFGSGTATIDGDLIIETSGVGGSSVAYTDGGGVVNVNSTGSLAVNSGTFFVEDGPLNINASASMSMNATGFLDVASSNTFYVAGNVNNQVAANGTNGRNNTVYADDSWAIFEDVDVEETDESYPYGNLEVRATSGTMTIENGASDRVFLSNNLAVNTNSLNLLPNSSTLTMLDETASPSYDVATAEVVGMMARRTNGTSNTLTYNNSQMLFNISSGSGSVSEVALDSRPGNENSDYQAARDVQRTVDLYYQATDNFVAQMRFSYLDTEAPSSTINEVDLRFREDQGSGTTEKVSTGSQVTRDATAAPGLRWVQLDGIRRSGDGGGLTDLAEVDNPGTLFLRGGPTTYISINSGRWSNPNTWDEGEQPGYRDEAVVRHTVHIGYNRSIDNFGDNTIGENIKLNNQRPGETISTGIASRILIDGAYGDLSSNPSEVATLLTGNDVTVSLYNDNEGGAVERTGYLDIAERNGALTGALTNGSNVGTTVTDGSNSFNRGFVVFAGSTFIVYNVTLNNNNFEVDENAEVNLIEPSN